MSLSIQLITVSVLTLQIQLRHNQIAKRDTWLQRYDFIVVGAGSAGAVVAHRLSENPSINVLLLEAGLPQTVGTDIPASWTRLLGTEVDWNYRTVPQVNYGQAVDGRVYLNRGRVIGGSSSINAMIYNRGHRRGYDEWRDAYGARGWGFDDVLPYFILSENNTDPTIVRDSPGYHGVGGRVAISSDEVPQPILELNMRAMNEWGYETVDINGAKQLGVVFPQNYIDPNTGLRASTGSAYIDPNPHPNNLHILTGAYVVKVLFDNNRRAIGVEFVRNGQTYQTMVNREVVISGGTINSPQLLMLSGIGPKEHLRAHNITVLADLPVGDHLRDHALIGPVSPIMRRWAPLSELPNFKISQMHELLTQASGALSRSTVLYTYYNTMTNDMKDWPNTITGTFVTDIVPEVIDQLWPRNGDIREKMGRELSGQWLLSFASLYRVRSEGTVRLASANPNDHPLIDPKYLSHPLDFEDMVETVKFIFRSFTQSSLAQYLYMFPEGIPRCLGLCPPNQQYYECDPYIRCFIRQLSGSLWHPVGTCRMGGTDRSDTVVTPELSVRGVGGVRVCDASVMPRIPNANTNAATIMIGEKCSHLIRQHFNL